QALAAKIRILLAEGNNAPWDHTIQTIDDCLDVLRVDIVAGDNDNILLPADDVIFASVPKAIVSAQIPSTSNCSRGLLGIVSITVEHRRRLDQDLANLPLVQVVELVVDNPDATSRN